MLKKLMIGAGLACLAMTAVLNLTGRAANPLETVPNVQLERYMGKWYEIALIPMYFERKCAANTTAEYALLDDGRLKVLNSCEKADGSRMASEGRARVIEDSGNAKLDVTFAHFFGRWWFLFSGDYWVIQLADDYSYAVVGHPDRKYGWILSRTAALETATLQTIHDRLITQGYDPCDFITRRQKGGLQVEKPLCELVKDTTD